MEELFTDRDAAQFLEAECPKVAQAVKRLLALGQSPTQVSAFLKARFPGKLVVAVIDQAAHYYQEVGR